MEYGQYWNTKAIDKHPTAPYGLRSTDLHRGLASLPRTQRLGEWI